jgi:hypothetical protein
MLSWNVRLIGPLTGDESDYDYNRQEEMMSDNAPMPITSVALPGSLKLKEMIVNEEGMFNTEFRPNIVARRLIAEGSNLPLSDIQEIMGDVFVTDGWSLN